MRPKLVEPRLVKYLYAKSALKHIPISGTFELTPMCNMKCEMCYVRMNKEDMDKSGGRLRSKEEWLKIAEDAQKEGLVFLLLTGGEPFLYPEFKELYQELCGKGFVISINSNATMIDDEVLEWLKDTPPTRINITLYGASDETYDRLCHNPKGFTQVTSTIKKLRNAGISVKLNCSVTPYNVGDLPEMIKFADENELVLQASSYMFPPLRRDEKMVGKNNRFTPEDAAKAAVEIVRLQNGDERFVPYVESLEEGTAKMDSELDECIEVSGDKIKCTAGRCAFWITWDGRMLPCGMMPCPIEYPFSGSFKDAWDNMVKKIEEIQLPSKCAKCKLKKQCATCAAMVYTETGGFEAAPEYRCRMAECYLKDCHHLVEEMMQEY